jgi:hypothetical protein
MRRFERSIGLIGFAITVFVSQAGCASSCISRVVGNESAVAVMMDFSATFAPYDAQDEQAIHEIGRTIFEAARSGYLQQPVKVQWAAFGDQGLLPLAPCGPPVVFSQRLTPQKQKDIQEKTRSDDFAKWLGECAPVIKALSHSPQQYTDVSGALAFAASATREARSKRLLILYSDLLEDLPRDRSRSTFDLSGDDVLIVWRPGLDDRKQPSEVQKRVAAASALYKERGATRVCETAAQTITSGDVLSCLTTKR